MPLQGPVHTGDKVEFNMGRLSGDRVDRIDEKELNRVGDNVDRNKLSNSSCCRFVAKTDDKVDRISDKVNFVADLSPVSAVCTELKSTENQDVAERNATLLSSEC